MTTIGLFWILYIYWPPWPLVVARMAKNRSCLSGDLTKTKNGRPISKMSLHAKDSQQIDIWMLSWPLVVANIATRYRCGMILFHTNSSSL